ncbi:MAG: hypothetical protein U0U69_05570 [Acidimicrobiia bacterium]
MGELTAGQLLAVVEVEVDRFEEGLVELLAHSRLGLSVGLLAIGQERQGCFGTSLDVLPVLLASRKARLGLAQIGRQTLLFLLEEVEPDGAFLVGVQQLAPLRFQPLDRSAVPPTVLLTHFDPLLKLMLQADTEGAEHRLAELDGGVVLFDHLLDGRNPQMR